jgi:predicted patatin/cPLA2 family phospholipase
VDTKNINKVVVILDVLKEDTDMENNMQQMLDNLINLSYVDGVDYSDEIQYYPDIEQTQEIRALNRLTHLITRNLEEGAKKITRNYTTTLKIEVSSYSQHKMVERLVKELNMSEKYATQEE